jgi:hypothetical protein
LKEPISCAPTLTAQFFNSFRDRFAPLHSGLIAHSVNSLLNGISQTKKFGVVSHFFGMQCPDRLSHHLAGRGVKAAPHFLLHPLLHFISQGNIHAKIVGFRQEMSNLVQTMKAGSTPLTPGEGGRSRPSDHRKHRTMDFQEKPNTITLRAGAPIEISGGMDSARPTSAAQTPPLRNINNSPRGAAPLTSDL